MNADTLHQIDPNINLSGEVVSGKIRYIVKISYTVKTSFIVKISYIVKIIVIRIGKFVSYFFGDYKVRQVKLVTVYS